MLYQFLQKQKKKDKKIKLVQTMIGALHVSEEQKSLYLDALSSLNTQELEDLFGKLTKFVEKIEIKELEDIKKQSFTTIAGMRKKEAEEKTQDINALSFLFHNI